MQGQKVTFSTVALQHSTEAISLEALPRLVAYLEYKELIQFPSAKQ